MQKRTGVLAAGRSARGRSTCLAVSHVIRRGGAVNQQSPSARRYELSRRQLLRAGAFGSAAASVGVLGACSSGASTATTRTAAKKANLVIAFSDATDSDTLDPAAAQDTYGATLVSNIYEPLCAIDFSQ